MPMEISEVRTDTHLRVSPSGRLDATTSPALQEKLLGLIEAGDRRMVIDFSELDYVSSAGLRVILIVAKRLKSTGGALALCCMKPHIKEVFDIAGFSAMLSIHPTQEEAVSALK